MFTGIIETVGVVESVSVKSANKTFIIRSGLSSEVSVDNSVAHNGVCLTVESHSDKTHIVTAVHETLMLTNLDMLKPGSLVNLERSMKIGGRLEGHLVQGHVDGRARCVEISEQGGSHIFTFELSEPSPLLVHKGSVCINGVSLTVIDPKEDVFSVAIIPYTFEHTNFKTLGNGDVVNIEFDILGKYVQRLLAQRK